MFSDLGELRGEIGLPTRSIDTFSVVHRERSSDAEDPDATSEGADSEAEAEQSHHEAGGCLALLGFADLEEDSQIGNCHALHHPLH